MRLALLSPLLPAALAAQSPASLPLSERQFVAVAEPVVALRHVKVVDGTGAAPATDQTIVIEKGRISWVGPSAGATVPASARVLDLAGHTVIPGMVGLHDHT